jgi:hypothetical protein
MGSMGEGNDKTHELLERLLNRVISLEANVKRLNGRVSLVVEPNVPIDPNYRNYELEAYQTKYKQLIPMGNDEMFVDLEQALTASACAAGITETPDKVCFLPVLAIEMF